MAVLLRLLQTLADQWIGRGLPAPADAIRRAGFRPDRPWSWCPRCGGAPHGGSSGAVPGCPGSLVGAPDCVVRLAAHRGPVQRWVVDTKHSRWEAMAERLGAELGLQLERCGAVDHGDPGTVVVSMPAPRLRSLERGIDHAGALANAVCRACRLRRQSPLRQLHVGTQVGRAGRESRSRRAPRFVLTRGAAAAVAGVHVVLVDDVRTTGATLADAARLLRIAGAGWVTAAVVSVRERTRAAPNPMLIGESNNPRACTALAAPFRDRALREMT